MIEDNPSVRRQKLQLTTYPPTTTSHLQTITKAGASFTSTNFCRNRFFL